MSADEKLASPLSDRFNEALAYAADLHRKQARKGTQTPYISHLLTVAGLVLENGGDEEETMAALLHDAIEDQGGPATGEEIRRRFGEAVFDIVMGCTDAAMPKGETKPPWRERKEAYIAHVRHAPSSVRLVSAADKLHNARAILSDYRDLGDKLWSRFTGSREGTLWYYGALVKAFREGEQTDGLRRLVDELERVVNELEMLAKPKVKMGTATH
jgi:(p)ppGpp synthase/HD superfamily hydrolase